MKYLVIIFAVFFYACGDKPTMPGNSTPSATPIQTGTKTPKGVTLKLTSPLNLELQNTIDSALIELFSDVVNKGYRNKVNFTDYTITIKDDCVNRGGTMSWLDRLDAYDGTEYDQDPRPGIGMIYRAEQVTLSQYKAPEFIICRDVKEIMVNTTRYGAEHIILYYNNMAEYKRTEVHPPDHPIIPFI